jgi:23S rRNA (cytidine1920-2'-O)/16S rRNA (cytidine1409-2'-O)-methyltransferase
MAKRRLDSLLLDRGLVESREKARAVVMAGQVTVGSRPVSKPGTLVDEAAPVELAQRPRYVSRGGEKLERALEAFGIDVSGAVAVDVGSSTGGFTDCLLQHGARRVYAIDVGKGQLDYRLRQDERVVVMEGVNIRHVESLPEPLDVATVDVSFISLRLVLPVVARLVRPGAEIVVLFKPQFEAEKEEVPRGGVIKDPHLQASLLGRFAGWCTRNGFRIRDLTSSPILGSSGNREFLLWLRAEGAAA